MKPAINAFFANLQNSLALKPIYFRNKYIAAYVKTLQCYNEWNGK
jgi:hypothetical protein